MNFHYNLGPRQHCAQQRVERFNESERRWNSLAGKRRLRRGLFGQLSPKVHEQLDLLDFAAACPPADCVGWFGEPQR